jgi:hypothetical protein
MFRTSCTIVATALLLVGARPGMVAAQGGLDRSPLDFPVRVAPSTDTLGISPLVALVRTDTLFTWFVSPSLVAVDSTRGYGFAVGIATNKLIPNLPLGLSISDRYMTVGGEGHHRMQFDLQFAPSLPIPRTSLKILGRYRNTAQVSTSQQGTMQLDVSLVKKAQVELGVGGLVYYGHEAPDGAVGQSGATFGTAASLRVGRLAMAGEYDFKSDFAGEDNYSVQAAYTLPVKRRLMGVQGLVGYGKHGVWIFGLKAALLGPVRIRA